MILRCDVFTSHLVLLSYINTSFSSECCKRSWFLWLGVRGGLLLVVGTVLWHHVLRTGNREANKSETSNVIVLFHYGSMTYVVMLGSIFFRNQHFWRWGEWRHTSNCTANMVDGRRLLPRLAKFKPVLVGEIWLTIVLHKIFLLR